MDFLNKKEAALNKLPHRLLTKSIEKFTLYAFLPLAFSILVNHCGSPHTLRANLLYKLITMSK